MINRIKHLIKKIIGFLGYEIRKVKKSTNEGNTIIQTHSGGGVIID